MGLHPREVARWTAGGTWPNLAVEVQAGKHWLPAQRQARGLVAVLEIALMVGMDASVGAHKDVMFIWRPNEANARLWRFLGGTPATQLVHALTSVCSRLRQDPPPKKFVVPEAPEPQRVPGHCDASLCE